MPICRAGRFWETYPQEIWNLFSEAIFLNFSNVHCHEPQSKADAFQKNIENDVSMFLFFWCFNQQKFIFFSSKGTKFRGGVIEGILDFSPQKKCNYRLKTGGPKIWYGIWYGAVHSINSYCFLSYRRHGDF